MVRAKGSLNTVEASEKEIPRRVMFSLALTGSPLHVHG